MSKIILIIGGKPIELKDKEILRTYENICRINLNMKYKDPESRDIFYVNNHINSNMVKSRIDPKQLKNTIYKFVDLNVLEKFYNMLNKKEYSEIIEQYESGRNTKSNKFLEELGCPYKFSKVPRCGYQAILYFLKNNYKVHVMGFSVKDDNICSYYNDRIIKGPSGCHNHSNEIIILNWLIDNKFIDKVYI
tara:strand:- start:166 stop:738 length:573 start_codon:yes stop_codon:yes gene_type:complete